MITGLVVPTGFARSYIPCQSASDMYAPWAIIQASPISIFSAAIILTPGVIKEYFPMVISPSCSPIFQDVN